MLLLVVNPFWKFFKTRNFGMGFSWGKFFVPGMSLNFVGSPSRGGGGGGGHA